MYTSLNEIPTIVDQLRKTFKSGLTRNIDYRKQQLKNFMKLMQENEDAIIDAIEKDLHKHKLETISGEISPVVGEIEYMLKNIERLAKTEKVSPRYKINAMDQCLVRKEPKGVALVMGAWNYPINLLFMPVVGAIAAGCCVVIKPSEVATHTSDFIAATIPKYLDSRSYRVVQGSLVENTKLLEQHFDHIFYTGNGRVGKIVMTAAAKHLTPVTLELGGKSPVIIADDADIELAASRILWAKFYNGGQICVAPDYILISKDRVDEFIDVCRRLIHKRYGEHPQKSDSFCRIIGERQFDSLQELLDEVDPKLIAVGGETDKSDLYVAPTIIGPVEASGHPLMEKEIFGPILPVVPVESLNEAIDIVNFKDTPLALYIFTDDKKTREKILDHTQSGGVVVNDLLMQVQELALPFGGVGPSGMGSYHGDKSFDSFTHERSTMIKSSGMESAMAVRYPPYSDSKTTLFAIITMGLPQGVWNKAKAVFDFMKAAKNVFFAKETGLP